MGGHLFEVVLEVGEKVGAGTCDPDGSGLVDEGPGVFVDPFPVAVEVFVVAASVVADAGEHGLDGVLEQDLGGLLADLEEAESEFGHIVARLEVCLGKSFERQDRLSI